MLRITRQVGTENIEKEARNVEICTMDEEDWKKTPRRRGWWPHEEGGTHYGGACDLCRALTEPGEGTYAGPYVSPVDGGPRCRRCYEYEIEENQG
jgi:hypothetical protein